MTEYQFGVVASVTVVPLLPLAISITFYLRDEPDPWWRRLAAYGPQSSLENPRLPL